MSEIIFVVEEAPEGGYSARAVGESIFTQAETAAELHERVRDSGALPFRRQWGT